MLTNDVCPLDCAPEPCWCLTLPLMCARRSAAVALPRNASRVLIVLALLLVAGSFFAGYAAHEHSSAVLVRTRTIPPEDLGAAGVGHTGHLSRRAGYAAHEHSSAVLVRTRTIPPEDLGAAGVGHTGHLSRRGSAQEAKDGMPAEEDEEPVAEVEVPAAEDAALKPPPPSPMQELSPPPPLNLTPRAPPASRSETEEQADGSNSASGTSYRPFFRRGRHANKSTAVIEGGANISRGGSSEDGAATGSPFPHIYVKPALEAAFKRYQALHADMVAGRRPMRAFVYKPTGQLCNILRGILAAFAFSLVTDRALFVHSPTSSWHHQSKYYELFERPGFDLVLEPHKHRGVQKPGKTIDMDQHWEDMLCGDLDRHETFDAEVLYVRNGAKYFVPFLYRNPRYQHIMEGLFADGSIAAPLASLLFRPVREVWEMKQAFEAAHYPASQYRISFHIRTEHFPTEAEWSAYHDCADAVTPPDQRNTSVWFVATDTEQSRQHILRTWTDRRTVWMGADEPFKPAATNLAQRMAIVDILLAAEGNKILLSPSSSYSGFIGLFARTDQLLMVTDGKDMGGSGSDADPHKNFTDVHQHCHRFKRREFCPWLGPQMSFSKIIQKAKCYTPDMQLDYC